MSVVDIRQAVADAREAEAQAAQIAQILAVVQAVQAQIGGHHSCTCQHARPRRSAGELAALGAGACACAGVAVAALLAVAVAAVAVGITATVLYLIWRQVGATRAEGGRR